MLIVLDIPDVLFIIIGVSLHILLAWHLLYYLTTARGWQ